jgi:Flp pilus assembly CpaF family ATPase
MNLEPHPVQRRSVAAFVRLYQFLLRAYPASFRQRFQEEMLQGFHDQCQEVERRWGLLGLLGLWATEVSDVFWTALRERLASNKKPMPTFVHVTEHLTLPPQVAGQVWGPLQALIQDETITAIYVNNGSPRALYVEREGRLEYVGEGLTSETIYQLVEQVAGKRPTEACPLLTTRLDNGYLVDVFHHVLGGSGATLTIRRAPRFCSGDTLVQTGVLTAELWRFLQAAVRGGLNIVISGIGRAGKTTLLNALLNATPTDERLLVLEQDVAELDCREPRWMVHFYPSLDASAGPRLSVSDLLEQGLRMTAVDRVVVGDCADAEARKLLFLMESEMLEGGVQMAIRADSPEGALHNLVWQAALSPQAPAEEKLFQQITQGVHLIVHLEYASQTNQRFVERVVQLSPYIEGSFDFTSSELFITSPAREGICMRTSIPLAPHLVERLAAHGVDATYL